LNKVAKNSCLLYEWIWNPTDCMMRWVIVLRGDVTVFYLAVLQGV
jgi:hypothetical protein